MKRWYALHTKPYVETRVAHQLGQWNIETFVPGMGTVNSRAGEGFRPLFPGYLFIRLNLQEEPAAAWLNCPGIRYIVSYDNEPAPIQDEVIRLLKQKVAELRGERKQGASRFKPGALVRIKDGPFSGLLAVFERNDAPGRRVRVLLQALDRSMRLRLSPSKLDVVDEVTDRRRKKRPRRTRGGGRRIKS